MNSLELIIIPRDVWTYEKPLLPTYGAIRPAHKVFIQNTHSPPCPNDVLCRGAVRYLEFKYLTRNKNDIVYNFLIGGGGSIYECRGWSVSPRLPRQYIDDCQQSILIAFIGYYKKDELPLQMATSMRNLIDYGIKYGHISNGYKQYNILVGKRFKNEWYSDE